MPNAPYSCPLRAVELTLLTLSLSLSLNCAAEVGDAPFTDCKDCPEMVVVPAGTFMMGTPVEQRVNDPVSGKYNANEEPAHQVTIAQPFAFGKYEVTVAQFRAFVEDSGYDASDGCFVLRDGTGRMTMVAELDWSNPGFAQAADEPVVCVSLDHANAYSEWLSGKTGEDYFIPSEAQWEYAAKAGTSGRYFWGDDPALACDFANVTFDYAEVDGGYKGVADVPGWQPPCDDGYQYLAPVGKFEPNAFGIHDTIGNVWEWVTDCSHKNYSGAPTDGSAWLDDSQCLFRIIRSGGSGNDLTRTTSVVRAGRPKSGTAQNLGFRVARSVGARDLPKQEAPTRADAQRPTSEWPVDSEAGALFSAYCAACHRDASSYMGVYGKDAASITAVIRDGGNNIMSMPAFGSQLSDQQIQALAVYLREQKGWD